MAGATFEEAVRRVKEGLKVQPERLKKIRRSRTGDVLLEFNPRVDVSGAVESLKKALGEEAKARRLRPMADIEPMTTKGDVAEAIKDLAGGLESAPECG